MGEQDFSPEHAPPFPAYVRLLLRVYMRAHPSRT
jgi:hypothetical protein